MDITAIDGKFYTGMMHRFDGQWNDDKTISIWSKKGESPTSAMVTTNRGTFVEVLNESGEVVDTIGDGLFSYVGISKKPTTLRFKKFPKLNLSKAQIQKQRETVTRYLVYEKPFNLKIPDTLEGAIQWMQKQLAAIPAPCRKKARFEFGTTMEYGETYGQIEITYSELETEKETILRLQIEAERNRLAEIVERSKLEQLKSKFEPA